MWHWVPFPLLWTSKALPGVGGNGKIRAGEGTGASAVLCYLLGRETSASEPRDTPRLRRMKAAKGFSRNSTSPTAIWAASAPGGTFFLNLFLSWKERDAADEDSGYCGWTFRMQQLLPA